MVQNASVSEIANMKRPTPNYLYWPNLDVDLAADSIRHPEKFLLISKESRPATDPRRRLRERVRVRSRAIT